VGAGGELRELVSVRVGAGGELRELVSVRVRVWGLAGGGANRESDIDASRAISGALSGVSYVPTRMAYKST
jgi:hypothetical protein